MAMYSHTRLSCFETCPRRYWYAYVGRVEVPEVETVEAFLGSRVHDVLEELYRRLMNGRLMTREELLAWYEARWRRRWSDGVLIVRTEYSADDYRAVGRDGLAGYYERYHPFTQARTLRLEARVLVDLDSARNRRMQGYIDRLARRPDGTWEVHDYKTSGHLPTQADADGDRQLALYQLAVQQMWPDADRVELVWHYLRFDAEIRSRRTAEQLETVKAECNRVVDDIESRGGAESSFPTGPSSLCDWCEYRQICPATRHPAAVAGLEPEQFRADQGVQLVDRWADIRRRRAALAEQDRDLEAEEEEVSEQLIAFAREQGLETVAGSTHRAEIRERVEVDFPRADEDQRQAFEAALRRLNLQEQVVTVNHNKLKSLLSSVGELPAEARQVIGPFLTETHSFEARLRKREEPEE